MSTNLAIDDKLLEEARIVGKHATKKAVVNEALAEYIQRRKQTEIIKLFHSVEYDPCYDYKLQRKKR
ncbi:MAG: type II toxin-antitoxin system VapB family antitoxin [Geobacteraceae bacterium]